MNTGKKETFAKSFVVEYHLEVKLFQKMKINK